jgi:4-amino-4-deoxy-L-arabinose transferase-like glycosyltransferase
MVKSTLGGPVSEPMNGFQLTECAMTERRQPEAFLEQRTGAILLILTAAFLLTAAILFLVLPRLGQVFASEYNLGFTDGYDLIANNLVQGSGYRFEANASETMMREPGYPLFLAGAFKIGGYNIETGRWANWLLTIGIAFLMMRLTQMTTNDRTTSLIATLLLLFYPSTLVSEARGGGEILFILVVLVFMLSLHQAVAKGNRWRYLVAGLALGVVVQVRSTPLVFPFLLLLYLSLFAHGATARLKVILNVAVLVLGMMIVMVPWVVRNFMLVHHLVPTATVQGVALQEGLYTCQHLTFDDNFYTAQNQAGRTRAAIATELGLPFKGAYYYQVFYDARDEWAFNKILFQRTEKEYVDHPALLAGCASMNLFNFWFLGKTWHATSLNMLVQIPLLVLALSGLHVLRRRGQLPRMGIMLTFVFCIVAVHLPTIAHARHSVPLVPFLVIPASVAIGALWNAWRRQVPKRTGPITPLESIG